MGQLDASIVTLAVPDIQRELHSALAAVEWVALVYLLVLVGSLPAIGRLADMAGRKLFYTYGFGLFTAASLACALAPDLRWLLAARGVQALGAAMLQANSVALIRTSVPRHLLGRAIGIQGAAQAIGLALGPSAGGLLISLGGWRWVFLVNLPAGILGLALGWFLLPRTRVFAPRTRFDFPGLALLLPALAGLLLAFSEASRSGFGSPLVLGLLAFAAATLAAFIARQRRTPSPLVDLSLFRAPGFGLGLSSGLLSYLVLFGVLFVTPLYLQSAAVLPPAAAGILLTVLPVGLGIAAPFGGLLADRHGRRLPTTAGMALAAAGLALHFAAAGNPVGMAGALAVIGAGLGLFTPANNASIASAGHSHQAGMVSGILNMTRGIGTSLGVAVPAAVYALAAGGRGRGLFDAGSATAGFNAAVLLLVFLALAAGALAYAGTGRHRS